MAIIRSMGEAGARVEDILHASKLDWRELGGTYSTEENGTFFYVEVRGNELIVTRRQKDQILIILNLEMLEAYKASIIANGIDALITSTPLNNV